jgi:hypothetical protein
LATKMYRNSPTGPVLAAQLLHNGGKYTGYTEY